MSSSSTAVSAIARTADMAPLSLCAREPHVPADRLVAEMVPPPRFDAVRFDTYIPDPNQPSQAEAVRVLGGFAEGLGTATGNGGSGSGGGLKRWFRRGAKAAAPSGPRGVYLDGGYGVGKPHPRSDPGERRVCRYRTGWRREMGRTPIRRSVP